MDLMKKSGMVAVLMAEFLIIMEGNYDEQVRRHSNNLEYYTKKFTRLDHYRSFI